ncbi:hypothetical protein CP336_18670 [Pseudomonas fluorescens]|nr:hypothetical protein CP336_18670 [Pseudomonas fluorescens]
MNMIIVKAQDLVGPALDWAVARSQGIDFVMRDGRPAFEQEFDPELPCNSDSISEWKCWTYFQPSTDWSQCGPLIEKVRIGFGPVRRAGWVAHPHRPNAPTEWLEAEEPLVAICRAIVADKLGMVVSVPAELIQQ